MSPRRALAVALLVALAGCTGVGTTGGDTTTGPTTPLTTSQASETTKNTDTTTADSTTEPHTAVGTSHHSNHFSVRTGFGVENLTVTLAPDGDSETFTVSEGDELDLTHEIHERGHDVRVVVERGDEVVFDRPVYDYENYGLTVYEDDVSVDYSVV